MLPDFGQSISEAKLKQALVELCSDLHFDMGGKLDLYHPRISEWQGVFHNGRHVGTMGRGILPEFNVYGLFKGQRTHVLQVGWRTTLEHLVRSDVPGVTWPRLCLKLGIDYKKFTGRPTELEVA